MCLSGTLLMLKQGIRLLPIRNHQLRQTVSGTIIRVGPSVYNDSRSFPVEAEIPNEKGAIKPGSFARLSILTRTIEDILTVPENAVFSFAGSPRVFVIENGKAREKTVETTGKIKDRIMVAKGLRAGEKVAVTGVELLSDGTGSSSPLRT